MVHVYEDKIGRSSVRQQDGPSQVLSPDTHASVRRRDSFHKERIRGV